MQKLKEGSPPLRIRVNEILSNAKTLLEVRNLPLPPSVNKLYFTRAGRRHLSSEGSAFKNRVVAAIAKEAALQPKISTNDNPLLVIMQISFDKVLNDGWSKGTASSRYKKIDTSNRIKVLEDAISEALGIDDRQFFILIPFKVVGEEGVDLEICEFSDHLVRRALCG